MSTSVRTVAVLLPLLLGATSLSTSGCALFKLAAVKKSHPQLDGSLVLPELSAPVQVHRDSLGVPHIRAETELDAVAAMGFVHAQDRLFQADLRRHLAWGQISPWLGEGAVELDLFMQATGLRQQAEDSLAAMSPEGRAVLDAYTAGFNAGIESLPADPIEYRLLKAEVEPWTAADVFSTIYLQSWNLAENPGTEAFALLLREQLSSTDADRLFRLSGEGPATEAAWNDLRKADIAPFSPGYLAFTSAMGGMPKAAEASNNWVIGPERSADGSPIVANDPHLGQGVPSLWYAIDVQGGDLHVAGVSLAGVPGVVIGHNEHVAWGLTNVMTDSVDMAVVKKVADGEVLVGGQVERLQPVKVRAGDREETAWRTSLGPVISTLDAEHLVVLRWHALEWDDYSLDAFFDLNHAQTVQEGLDAFKVPFLSIAQNLVIADVNGDFAWQEVGAVVAREGYSGRVPYDASGRDNRWVGTVAQLPGERAPERGYAHTANAKPVDDNTTFTSFYVPPWRHNRIDELLAADESLDVADMTRIQNDLVETQAQTLLPAMLEGVSPSTEAGKTCKGLLSEWDHEMRADSAGAAAWALFQREFHRSLLADELGEEGASMYLSIASSGRNALSGDHTEYLPDPAATVDQALDAACTVLSEELGDDPSAWTWGELHPLRLQHPFARSSKLLSKWNMEELPWAGNGNTVAAAGHTWRRDEMPVGGMVSMRIVMPLSDLGSSTLVHPGGQSGQPRHPLYATHYGSFVEGGTEPLWFDEDDVERETVWTLELTP